MAEVSEQIFPDPSTRPSYLVGVVSHGLYSPTTFSTVHAGVGSTLIGALPSSVLGSRLIDTGSSSQTSQYLMRQILEAPTLAGREVSAAELVQAQFEKLVANALINPLTVVFNCRNGELLRVPEFQNWMRLLLNEASAVLAFVPELTIIPGSSMRFSSANLEKLVLAIVNRTAKNESSMLQDVRAGRETEIDYINGYIVARGEQFGIDCPYNRELVEIIKNKHVMKGK